MTMTTTAHWQNPHYDPNAYCWNSTIADQYAHNLQEAMLGRDYPGLRTQIAEVARKLEEFLRKPTNYRTAMFARSVLAAWEAQDYRAMRDLRI